MTVRLITTINVYSGLSTDNKPTSGVREGSVFHELDTGWTFQLNVSSWIMDKSASLSIGQYEQGNAELRRIMEQTLLEVQAANIANEIEVI